MDKSMLNEYFKLVAKSNMSDPKDMEEIIHDIFEEANQEEWLEQQIKIRKELLEKYIEMAERRGYNNPFKDITIKKRKQIEKHGKIYDVYTCEDISKNIR